MIDKLVSLSLLLKNCNSWYDYFLRNLDSSVNYLSTLEWVIVYIDLFQHRWGWIICRLIPSGSYLDTINIFITLATQGYFHYLTPCCIIFSRLYILYGHIFDKSGSIFGKCGSWIYPNTIHQGTTSSSIYTLSWYLRG